MRLAYQSRDHGIISGHYGGVQENTICVCKIPRILYRIEREV